MAAAMFDHGRSARGRRRTLRENEEFIALDFSRDVTENVHESLTNIARRDGVSRSKKIAYYNAIARLVHHHQKQGVNSSYSNEEIISCLSVGLFCDTKEMRAACLRSLRYVINDESSIDALLKLNVDYLIARCIDVCLDNEIERIHGLRLARKILQICPSKFPQSLLNVMISIANDGVQERDRMVKTCLASICELALYNPMLVTECGGISAILRNVLESYQLPRVNESLLATVLYLINHPSTRKCVKADVDLEQMIAPFTDAHYHFSAAPTDDPSVEKKNRYAASKMAITTIIRSWPGLIRVCKPDGSGLQSLLSVLYLPNMGTRNEILEVLFEIFRIPLPDWTDCFTEALKTVDPSTMQESWRLNEGFVAEEGKDLLPHLSQTRTNLVDNHIALILSAFIRAGALEALVDVVTSSDDKLAVRATILLGELLHLANTITPYEVSHHTHCLPSLMKVAASFQSSPVQRNRAQHAITCLTNLHNLKKRGVLPCSLFFDMLIKHAETQETKRKMAKDKLLQCLGKDSETDVSVTMMKESMVLISKENKEWDWDLISAILKWPDTPLKKFEDQANFRYLRRLLYYFKPSNKMYSQVEHNHPNASKITLTGLHLIEFLLDCQEMEAQRCIEELLNDIASCLAEVHSSRAPHDALFTPNSLLNSLSRYYFLFIGHFSSFTSGKHYLEVAGIFQQLSDLVTVTSHESLVKLTISSLDYKTEGMARLVLSKALTSSSDAGRLYSTKFMRVLLRAKVPFFATWGIELLVTQMYDQKMSVAMEAISIISEACEEEVNLINLVKMNPSVLHLGHKGSLLFARFLSIPNGFQYLTEINYIEEELNRWHKEFNLRYVDIVEERLNEALTTYEKTYDGSYTRRSASRKPRKDVYVPIHIYGQLVQHKNGYQLLEKQPYILDFFNCVKCQDISSDTSVKELKASLWAVGHIGTSAWGLDLLLEEDILPSILKITEESPILSLRGTGLYVLGLISSTHKGADHLETFGWETVKHKRSEIWPVLDTCDHCEYEPNNRLSISSTGSGSAFSSLTNIEQSESIRRLNQLFIAPENAPRTANRPPSDENLSFKSQTDSEDGYRQRTGTADSYDFVARQRTLTEDSYDFVARSRSSTDSNPPITDTQACDDQFINGENIDLTSGNDSGTGSHKSLGESDSFETPPSSRITRKTDLPKKHENGLINQSPKSSHSILSDPFDSSCDIKPTAIKSDEGKSDVKERSDTTAALEHFESVIDHLGSLSSQGDESDFRDQRTSSSESAQTNKSRSNSGHIENSSSGVSSTESSHHAADGTITRNSAIQIQVGSVPKSPENVTIVPSTLTPVPSDECGLDYENQAETDRPSDSDKLVHPSDANRRLVNLRRVPTVNRQYSSPTLALKSPLSSTSSNHSESMIYPTNVGNASGYATLRRIQTSRLVSGDYDAELNYSSVFDPMTPKSSKSLDYRLGRASFRLPRLPKVKFRKKVLSCPAAQIGSVRNLTNMSLHQMEMLGSSSSVTALTTSSPTKERSVSGGRAEYIGLCLPVVVTMMFQLNDDKEKSTTEDQESKKALPEELVNAADDGLGEHCQEQCLMCKKKKRVSTLEMDHLDPQETSLESSSATQQEAGRRRNNSFCELNAIGSSINSTTSIESSAIRPVLNEDSPAGRTLIRKEVLRLIINLSSSVGTKSSEQGLLSLKQKFPQIFQDLCLFSDVSLLLASYNFRLISRRFIQELFSDINVQEIYDDIYNILGISDAVSNSKPESKDVDNKLEKVIESIG